MPNDTPAKDKGNVRNRMELINDFVLFIYACAKKLVCLLVFDLIKNLPFTSSEVYLKAFGIVEFTLTVLESNWEDYCL